MDKLPDGEFKTYQNVQFEISYDMVPSFRLSIFAQHEGELLADSLQFEVENVCNTRAQVLILYTGIVLRSVFVPKYQNFYDSSFHYQQ